MIIGRGLRDSTPSGRRDDTTTGGVWSDILLNQGGVRSANILFPPGARTHWHRHPGGQFIYTLQGEGWIQERGGERVVLRPGDVVWTEGGVEHWHGATATNLVTQVILHFEDVEWTGPVTDEEYSGS
jgi:quercetin dioxygenase-like cupin family protein